MRLTAQAAPVKLALLMGDALHSIAGREDTGYRTTLGSPFSLTTLHPAPTPFRLPGMPELMQQEVQLDLLYPSEYIN